MYVHYIESIIFCYYYLINSSATSLSCPCSCGIQNCITCKALECFITAIVYIVGKFKDLAVYSSCNVCEELQGIDRQNKRTLKLLDSF